MYPEFVKFSYMEQKHGISRSTLVLAKKYKPYIVNATDGKHNAKFRYAQWRKDQDSIFDKEKVRNIVIYLKDTDVSFMDMHRVLKIQYQSIYALRFGQERAKRILKYLLENHFVETMRAIEYWGYSTKELKGEKPNGKI